MVCTSARTAASLMFTAHCTSGNTSKRSTESEQLVLDVFYTNENENDEKEKLRHGAWSKNIRLYSMFFTLISTIRRLTCQLLPENL